MSVTQRHASEMLNICVCACVYSIYTVQVGVFLTNNIALSVFVYIYLNVYFICCLPTHFLIVIFPLQVKYKPHDGVANTCIYSILELGGLLIALISQGR